MRSTVLWTKRLRIDWRPSMAFYEHRYAIMGKLEHKGLLRQFQVEDNRVSCRLGDAYHLMVLTPGRLVIAALQPDPDMDRLRLALDLVWEALAPTPLRQSAMEFQSLAAIEASYDDARQQACERIFDLPTGMTHEDFALLADIKDEALSAQIQLEAGVVGKHEIGTRLARAHRGAIADVEPETAPTLWQLDTLPDVALFCDQRWQVQQKGKSPDEILQAWATVERKAESATMALFEQLIGNRK